jgi:branched-chain amino acid transport system substrate-binding protein
LALADAGAKVGELAVRARYLGSTGGQGAHPRWSGAVAAASARRAAEDSTSIAYLGDFDSGATRFSLPITNEARLLQVSAASSAVDLVQPYLGAGDQVPEDAQPTGERTFGRVIPSDEAQAEAGAGWAKRLGARDALAASDDSSFGRTMRSAFAAEARSLGIGVGGKPLVGLFGRQARPPAGPVACPAVLFTTPLIYSAGIRPPAGLAGPCAGTWRPRMGVLGPDALMGPDALPLLGSIDHPVRLTSAAQDPSQLPAAGRRFIRQFRSRYGRPPGRYAAYGYEAMAVILDSIRRAGDSGDDREAVVDAFFETRNRDSILGVYSIDEVGNTTLNRLAGYDIIAGRPVFATSLRAP